MEKTDLDIPPEFLEESLHLADDCQARHERIILEFRYINSRPEYTILLVSLPLEAYVNSWAPNIERLL